jgi:hypothetical protein
MKTITFYLLLALLISGCKVPETIHQHSERETIYSITSISDSSSIASIEGLVKDLGEPGPIPYGMIYLKQNGSATNHAFIDSLGRFKVSNLVAGKYKIFVSSTYFNTVEMPLEIANFTKNEVTISIKMYEGVYLKERIE